jgi:hypothetical protein
VARIAQLARAATDRRWGLRARQWHDAKMIRMTRGAAALLEVLFATAAGQPRADATEPPRSAKAARAEIQIALCAPPDRIVQALDLHPRGTPLEVWHLDDSALTLFARGLRLRLRVTPDRRSELTLKVADQDCARLDPGFLPKDEGKCEYDVYRTSIAGAVSLNRGLSAESTDDLLAGRLAPEKVLSPAQIRYLREVVGIWPLPPGIRGLGPMQVRTYSTKGGIYDVDISQLPGGEQYAEIARKAPQADAMREKAALEAELSRAAVEICADQSSQAGNKLRALLR